jgi:iron complex outermembrane receptor protein
VESLRLTVGAAWDRASTPETGGLEPLGAIDDWGARAGVSAVMNDGGSIVHLGVSRRGRFPSLRETYSEALNRFVPNPDLSAEHLLTVEGGLTTRLGRGRVQVVAFHNRLTDAIRRITLEDGKRQRVNSDELESTGVELLLSQTVGTLDLGADLTLQTVDLTDPGTAISTEPENLPEQVGRAWARWHFLPDVYVQGEAEYTGTQFCQDPDTGQDVELDAGTWLNAALGKVWRMGRGGSGRRIETRVSGDNLTDTALYDQCGLPRPGRLLRFQVRVF